MTKTRPNPSPVTFPKPIPRPRHAAGTIGKMFRRNSTGFPALSSLPPSRSITTSIARRLPCCWTISASANTKCRPIPTPPSGPISATPRARPFRTLTDYQNWIAQMREIPRYFAGTDGRDAGGPQARLHARRSVTMQGRDGSITAVIEAKPQDNLFYEPFKDMPPASADDQKDGVARGSRDR